MYNISKQSPTEYLFEWKSTTSDSVYTCTCMTTPPSPLLYSDALFLISYLYFDGSRHLSLAAPWLWECDWPLWPQSPVPEKKTKTVKSPGYNFCELKDKLQQGNNLIYIHVYM